MPFLIVLLIGISNAFQIRPQNTVVKIGQSFELLCAYDSHPIDWYHRPLTKAGQERSASKITAGYNKSFLTFGNVRGERLNVTSAGMEHAGKYQCKVDIDGKQFDALATVIVLDGDPVCEMKSKAKLMENDNVEVICTLSHYGPNNPVMHWKRESGNGWENLNSTETNIVYQTKSRVIDVADLSMQGSQFIFETLFLDADFMNSKPDIANNTPDYRYIWRSPAIRVLSGPRNLITYPSAEDGVNVLFVNQQANCSAEGFPPPEIEWVNSETKEVTSGPVLEVPKSLVGEKTHVFICRAINREANRTENIRLKFKVIEHCSNSSEHKDEPKCEPKCEPGRSQLPELIASLSIICALTVYIIYDKIQKRRNEAARIEAILANIKPTHCVPVRRVNHSNNFPVCMTKVQPLDTSEYLSPRSDFRASCSNEYDEIRDMQSISVHNMTYLGTPVTKSVATPEPPSSRWNSDYLEASCSDVGQQATKLCLM